jgi:large subunit ribosomal protein L13
MVSRLPGSELEDSMSKTTLVNKTDIKRQWFLVDATGQTLGRLAVKIAMILRGRHKPIYAAHMDTGDYIIVINSDKIEVTGKKEYNKEYMTYSGYMGGEKYHTLNSMRKKNPEFIIKHAVQGMLPKNKLSHHATIKKLFIYGGATHPHQAQNPVPLTFTK